MLTQWIQIKCMDQDLPDLQSGGKHIWRKQKIYVPVHKDVLSLIITIDKHNIYNDTYDSTIILRSF